MDRLLYGFVHYESRFCHFTETCGSYPAHDVYNFHDVCKDRVVYPYFMPILILSVVFGSLRHLLVIISPYSMSTVIYFHYINLSIFRVIVKVKNLGLGVGTKGKPPTAMNNQIKRVNYHSHSARCARAMAISRMPTDTGK